MKAVAVVVLGARSAMRGARSAWFTTGAAVVLAALSGCSWNPSRPFEREAPQVKEAIAELDGGDAGSAAVLLEGYLSTGPCKDGIIGTPDTLARRADGTFDLGLALFRVGEQYGRRFGEEDVNEGVTEALRAKRHAEIECARRLAQTIASDDSVPSELRARARYLSGNLAFLDGVYRDAVDAYDRALVLAPGEPDGGDPVGRDAAYNRAIALRRIEDQKDAGPDASHDASGDASRDPDAAGDGGPPGPRDSGRGDGASGTPDGGNDAGRDAEPPPPQEPPDAGLEPPREAGAPPPPSRDEDQRMLDQLENAPTLQQEETKHLGKKRVRGMADK